MGTKARTPFNYPNMKVRSERVRIAYASHVFRELQAAIAAYVSAVNDALADMNQRLALGIPDGTIADALAESGVKVIEAAFETDGPVNPFRDGPPDLGPAWAPEDWMWSESEREAASRPVGTLRGEML